MLDFLMQTYTIALPIILGYIVWLLKQQKQEKKKDSEDRDKRLKEEKEMREANSKGTMLLFKSSVNQLSR